MVVDRVSHVIRLEEGQIEPPLPCVGKVSEEYIRGIGRVEEKLIVMLKIDHVLSTEDKIELDNLEKKKGTVKLSKEMTSLETQSNFSVKISAFNHLFRRVNIWNIKR